MPKDKSKMHEIIMEIAKQEFLNHGFEAASMRVIAEKSGITVSGLYKHFKNKDDMFGAFIQPMLDEMHEIAKQYEQAVYQYIYNNDIESMWTEELDSRDLIQYIYKHYLEFKLLICCSDGSSYCNFIEECVLMEEKMTICYMKHMEERGMHVHFLPEQEMHLLVKQVFTAMFETVVYDMNEEEAMHYISTISKVYITGMRQVLEF